MRRTTVLLADDHVLFTDGMLRILGGRFEIADDDAAIAADGGGAFFADDDGTASPDGGGALLAHRHRSGAAIRAASRSGGGRCLSASV